MNRVSSENSAFCRSIQVSSKNETWPFFALVVLTAVGTAFGLLAVLRYAPIKGLLGQRQAVVFTSVSGGVTMLALTLLAFIRVEKRGERPLPSPIRIVEPRAESFSDEESVRPLSSESEYGGTRIASEPEYGGARIASESEYGGARIASESEYGGARIASESEEDDFGLDRLFSEGDWIDITVIAHEDSGSSLGEESVVMQASRQPPPKRRRPAALDFVNDTTRTILGTCVVGERLVSGYDEPELRNWRTNTKLSNVNLKNQYAPELSKAVEGGVQYISMLSEGEQLPDKEADKRFTAIDLVLEGGVVAEAHVVAILIDHQERLFEYYDSKGWKIEERPRAVLLANKQPLSTFVEGVREKFAAAGYVLWQNEWKGQFDQHNCGVMVTRWKHARLIEKLPADKIYLNSDHAAVYRKELLAFMSPDLGSSTDLDATNWDDSDSDDF